MAIGDQFADRGLPQGVDESAGRIQKRWGDYNPLAGIGPKAPEVDTPSASWQAMYSKWQLISTVLAGTAAMREAGETYLPKHQYESDGAYRERLSRSTLKNYTLRTLVNLTSKALRDPPQLADDVPKEIVDLADDIDAEGSALHVFARSWFNASVHRGFSHVLVDYTRTERPSGSPPRTLEDDRAEGVRPFWRLVDPLDVIYMRAEKVGGKVRTVEARIREWEVVQDGLWGERCVESIRVLRPGSFELYEKRVARRGAKPKWVLVDSGATALDYVPLVTFYTAREGLCEGKPPLEDLAYLNVEHFQSSSDQRNILTVARFPILAVSGATTSDNNDKPIVIGPNQWLSVADPSGRIYYVEHAGNAIAAGRTDLEDLEDQMASYGSEFLRKRPGASSATGRALDSAEAISPLMGWGMDFKDALELALQYTADWLKLGEGKGGSVNFQIKPDVSVGESKELDALDKARERRDISRDTHLRELQRRDILSPEFDAKKDQELIDKEPPPDNQTVEASFKSAVSGGRRGPPRITGEPPVET